MHSRSCPSLWNAEIKCDCFSAYVHKLEKIAEAARSLLSEEGMKDHAVCYVMGVELIDRLAELESHAP